MTTEVRPEEAIHAFNQANYHLDMALLLVDERQIEVAEKAGHEYLTQVEGLTEGSDEYYEQLDNWANNDIDSLVLWTTYPGAEPIFIQAIDRLREAQELSRQFQTLHDILCDVQKLRFACKDGEISPAQAWDRIIQLQNRIIECTNICEETQNDRS